MHLLTVFFKKLNVFCSVVIVGPDDIAEFFSFRVHHGGHFDVEMEKYSGGSVTYIDWCSFDFLSILDLNKIAKYLGFKHPVGYWVGLHGGGKSYCVRNDVVC